MLGGAESRKTPATVDKLVRDQVVDGFAELGNPLGMLENLRSNIGKPQIACRSFEEAHLELILQLSNAATDGGERYLEAPRRF